MPFTRFDKPATKMLREKLVAHLASFEAEHGVKFDLGNAKFNDDHVHFVGFDVKIPGLAQPKNDANLRYALRAHGIDAKDVLESAEFTLVEYRSRAPKRPWLVRSKVDGKTYVLPTVSARIHFGK